MGNQNVSFNSQAVVNLFWTDLKAIVQSKSLLLQYATPSATYTIFALDNQIAYFTTIWTGTVPDDVISNGYSQAQNNTDLSDFTTNWQPTANKAIAQSGQSNTGSIPPAITLIGGANRGINMTSNRTSRSGDIRIGEESIFFWDTNDGVVLTVNPIIWNTSTTTMTVTSGQVTTLNANSTLTASTDAIITSATRFLIPKDVATTAYFRAKFVQQTNAILECGFGNPINITGAVNNGALFRINAVGATFFANKVGIGGEVTTALNVTLNSTSYYTIAITLEGQRANVQIEDNTGTVICSQWISTALSNLGIEGINHPNVFYRVWNSGVTSSAAQIIVSETQVYSKDIATNRSWPLQMASCGRNAYWDPAQNIFTAATNNNAIPQSVTVSNSGSGLNNLGGNIRIAAAVGAETYGAAFSYQVPANSAFFITGLSIGPPLVQGAAVVTAAALEWAVFINCSSGAVNSVGLAYSAFPVPGWHTAAAAAAIGTVFSGGVLTLPTQDTPIMCLPGTFINIAVKQVSGAATASLTYRTQVYVNGFFQ